MHAEGTEFKLPRLNPNDQRVDLIKWRVAQGEFVPAGADFAEVESSKATVTLQSNAAGYIHQHFMAGQSVPVGSTLATFYKSETGLQTLQKDSSPAPKNLGNLGDSTLSQAALAYVEKHGISPDRFKGMGLITTDILESLLGLAPASVATHSKALAPTTTTTAAQSTDVPVAGFRSERLSSSKRREISALTAGQQGLINSSLTVQFSSAAIRQMLAKHQLLNGQVLPLILFEFADLLRSYPSFLTFYENGHIHFYDRLNFGIAIDFGQDLRVPVIFDAADLTAAELAAQITANGIKYINNEFLPEDLTGGTITITDLSAHEVISFQPLLNERQAVILGIGGDKTAPGHPMTLTMVFDHRILSGRVVGEFLKKLKQRLLAYGAAEIDGASVDKLRYSPC